VDVCASEGVYVVRSLVNALWSIDGCHDALDNATRHRSLPAIPEVWTRFKGYNDWSAKKKRKPQLSSDSLSSHSSLLFGMLQKPVLRGKKWERFREAVEGLATVFSSCARELNKDAARSAAVRQRDEVARPLSSNADVEARECSSGFYTPTALEVKLESAL